jgi:quinoprotein glucose dehydrogenase
MKSIAWMPGPSWRSLCRMRAGWTFAVVSAACAIGITGIAHVKTPRSIQAATKKKDTEWPAYGGSRENSHYSSLKQINTKNVSKLQEVWRFDTKERGGLETTPVIVDGVLYAYTPSEEVIALDAASGKLNWQFNPPGQAREGKIRGLVYWSDGNDKRILASSANFIYAIDVKTGKSIPSFGDNGRIDLRENLRGEAKLQSVGLSSPGITYKDLLIVGGSVQPSPSDIRAYDVHSGKLRWTFHVIPHPGEFGYDTWPKDAWTYSGAAGNWAGMSLDTERGIVYVPTASAHNDEYGADRIGDDLFADSVVALNAETGQRIWHFQGVHHDIWDRDFDSPPDLVSVTRNGKEVPALVQASKQGFLFVFNRVDGTPLFPIENRPVPPSTVPGEVAAKEQPFPTKPAPISRQLITEDMLTNRTPEAHQWAVKRFHEIVHDGQFVPMSVGKETLMWPGFDGGGEWGGSAFDPETHLLYINANDVGLTEALVKHDPGLSMGSSIYMSHCSVCHGADRAGAPPEIPSLIGVEHRLTTLQITNTIQVGKGRMPAFPELANGSVQFSALMRFVATGKDKVASTPEPGAEKELAYDFTGYKKFLDPDGYPAVVPPWGTLNAININTGEYAWKIPFGEYPELVAKGVRNTGSESYGGPVVTAGGVVFIGATVADKKFHAYDKATGKLLWETTLPLGATATPATYEVNGRQYVVIAIGGMRDPVTPSGGMYVAFALPQ